MIVRKVKLRTLIIKEIDFIDVNISELDLSSVSKLILMMRYSANGAIAAQIRIIVNRCHSLHDVQIMSATADEGLVLYISPAILKQLKVLCWGVTLSYGITSDKVSYLAAHCKVLRDIHIANLSSEAEPALIQ